MPNLLRRLFHSAESTPRQEQEDSERIDFLAYLQVENARLRGSLEDLTKENLELRGQIIAKPAPQSPQPENFRPVGRKVWTPSQLKAKASAELRHRYVEESKGA